MPVSPIELEAKLLVRRPEQLRAIARLRRLGPYALRGRGLARLYSVYLDTPDFALARRRVALRLRRDAGRWEATAKWAARVEGGLHRRRELTVRLPGRPSKPFVLPAGPLARRLAPLVTGKELVPILTTTIERRRFDVVAAARPRRIVAELAIDRVSLRAPTEQRGLAAYAEIEVERHDGNRRDVLALALHLRRRFDLATSRRSKFARGFELVYGTQKRKRLRASIL